MRVLYQVLRKLLALSLYIGMSIGIVACEGATEMPITPVPSATATPAPVTKSIKANLSGVDIVMRVPPGWNGRRIDDGILIAEQRGSIHNTGKLMGMQVYIFVHAIPFSATSVVNVSHPARHILQQIITEPALVGSSAVSDPQAFTWDGNDAAYFLENDTNENVSLVMIVVMAHASQLVAINISCPFDRAASMRKELPDLLADLWVNNALMSVSALDALPDPLVFPTYMQPTAIHSATP